MALTDASYGKDRKRKNRDMTSDNARWGDQQKLDLIVTWLATGNLAMSARMHGIPEVTARRWKGEQWWWDAEQEIRAKEKIELSNRMKKMVQLSQDIVHKRLVEGDPVFDQKTGAIVMKPVSLKDAHKVAVDYIDRGNVLDKAMATEDPAVNTNDATLVRLAERFAAIASKSIEKHKNLEFVEEVIPRMYEGENHHAVHVEREEKL